MAIRTTRALIVLGAFVAGLVFCFGTVMLVTGQTNSPIRPAAAQIGGPFHLTDQNGRPVNDEDFRGKPFLVFFGYTHCPDVCPTTLFDVSEVLRRLGPDADKTAALFITVDPERDTPGTLKDYLGSFDPHLRGITGAPDAVAAVAKEFRVYYKKVPTENGDYSMDHTAIVYLMDKNGHFVAPFSLRRTPEASADDLRRYL
jgi:protein SCO1/2